MNWPQDGSYDRKSSPWRLIVLPKAVLRNKREEYDPAQKLKRNLGILKKVAK